MTKQRRLLFVAPIFHVGNPKLITDLALEKLLAEVRF